MFIDPSFKEIILLGFGTSKIERRNQAGIIGMAYFYSAPEINKDVNFEISPK